MNQYIPIPYLNTAFIRYVLVCHPTSKILTTKVLWMISIFITLLTCSGIIANAIRMNLEIPDFFDYQSVRNYNAEYGELHFSISNFNLNCQGFLYRERNRVLIEALIFFVIPASVSGV